MADIFISYKSERRLAAEHLSEILNANGYSTWYDYSLVSGQEFSKQIEKELRKSKAVLILWCSLSIDSDWVNNEAHLAKKLSKNIPIWIEKVDLPIEFLRDHTLNLVKWDGNPRSSLLDPLFDQIERLTGRPPAPQTNILRDLEKKWRRFGAPTLAQFAINSPIPDNVNYNKRNNENHNSIKYYFNSEKIRSKIIAIFKFIRNNIKNEILITIIIGVTIAIYGEFENIVLYKNIVFEYISNNYNNYLSSNRIEADFNGRPSAGENEFDTNTEILKEESSYRTEKLADPDESVTREFRDCPIDCPEMVKIPPGTYSMGSPVTERGRDSYEGPEHIVKIDYEFAIGKFEITFDQWSACVAGGGCKSNPTPDDKGWGRGERPVINITWKDSHEYVNWLSAKTGKEYRLASESEWEYAARAGSRDAYFWGNSVDRPAANCSDCAKQPENKTKTVGSYTSNAFGLYDMSGNVWEKVQDCWNKNYEGAPADGIAWEKGNCNDRVIRGGSWYTTASLIRSAARSSDPINYKNANVGFRVARTIVRIK